MKNIIILSKGTDLHVQPVIEHIKAMGGSPVLLDIKKNGENFSLTISEDKIVISDNERINLNLFDVYSIWYRRPVFKTGGDNVQMQWQKDFSEGEERETWDGIWLTLRKRTFFLNHPFCNRIAGNKVFQLNLAKEIGFKIPDFIVTNNPIRVQEFVKKHGKIIYKTLHHPKKIGKIEDMHVFFTNIVEEKHLQNLQRVSITPCLFQSYIEKTYEVRITVVGNEIFSERILSQGSLKTMIDWRREPSDLQHEIEILPQDVSERCIKLVKTLNLSYGAIDMIFNEKLDYVFLEINPNGQWLWMEKILGLPISKAIATILMKGGDQNAD